MVQRLAGGRHHLTRDEVAADQKQRLYEALAVVMARKGYSNTVVADLIGHAKVSRATFYEHFTDKQDCFMAGYRLMQHAVVEHVVGATTTGTPRERFATLLDRYLGTIAAHPETARLYLVEVYAAGPDAMRERMTLQQEFVAGVVKIFKLRTKSDRFAAESLVVTISALVTNALISGGADDVLALKKPLLVLAERLLPQSR